MTTTKRFVILEHDFPFLHWDLLLEDEVDARTWRLLEDPRSGRSVRAEPIARHRLHYLTYEGPVSGNRGDVHAIARGTWQP
ncbi:MAG: hypothetical protein KDA85_13115, partial [Planctomycetaceae bacterium]|nr:hypothetical protein [Planctomycetaceae bacterium]